MIQKSEQLTTPEIIRESEIVAIGSTVKIHYMHDDERYTETIHIVKVRIRGESDTGVQEVSIDFPLGRALLNNRIGDIVSFYIPGDNEKIDVLIVDIF